MRNGNGIRLRTLKTLIFILKWMIPEIKASKLFKYLSII